MAAKQLLFSEQARQKILAQPEPQPFRPPVPRTKPILGPFLSLIHDILDDGRLAPPKQRHTARRIYERLRDEHDYQGCASMVRAAVATYKQSRAHGADYARRAGGGKRQERRLFQSRAPMATGMPALEAGRRHARRRKAGREEIASRGLTESGPSGPSGPRP